MGSVQSCADGGRVCPLSLNTPPVSRLCVLTLVMCSLSGAAVAGVYRVAGKDMAPLEALVFGVGQTALSVVISFSRILATL